MSDPQPGDVILTRGNAWTSRLIRWGAALLDQPNVYNHVIVVHHRDAIGVLWGIEARAEGVGWVDLTRTLKSRWVLSNADQPKTPADREFITRTVEGAIATIDKLWRAKEFPEDGRLPYGTICSALADWAYEQRGLPNPGGTRRTRLTKPADWHAFIQTRGWVA
jgi:hypothetical protein